VADNLKVSVAFTADPFVASPTWTRIDNLAGIHVKEITIARGRPDELSKVSAGTAKIVMVDEDGIFDPTNGSSSHFPNVLPDRQAKIELRNPVLNEWQTIYRGFLEDLDFTLPLTRSYLEVNISLVDGLAKFADFQLQPGDGDTPPSGSEGRVVFGATTGGDVGDRIEAVYLIVGWSPSLADVFTGNVRVQETIDEPGTTALAALQDAADAEFPGVSLLYISRQGVLTFHGRQSRFRPDVAAYGIRRQIVGDPSVTDADATICPVHEMSFNLGKAQLYNSVMMMPQGDWTEAEIAAQLVEDATSIGVHGKRSLTYDDLITLEGLATGNDPLEECVLFATYYRDNYKDPLPRVSRMVFKSRLADHRLAGPLWKMLTRADISDRLTLTTEHPGGGGFSADDYYVEGLRYTIRPASPLAPYVELELDVSPAALFDDNTFSADTNP
jgi:hypothetical protein